MEVVACGSPDELARRAAGLVLDRLRGKPDLVMTAPAGRTPRAMFARLAAACGDDPAPFARTHVFAVDELCPPATGAGKRRALTAMLRGPVTPSIPASVLQRHRRCTVIAGMEALP